MCPKLITAVAFCSVLGGRPASAQEKRALPPLPPPGELVDVGGWRVHLHCMGEPDPSRPTVILEAGAGDFSVEWSLVLPEVAGFARVCSYDRAGMGWSELGPRPRTLHQLVYELHTLLERGGVRPPFVLVGHSMGGWMVRTFTSQYPTEVIGLVLIEPGVDDPLRVIAGSPSFHSSERVTGQPLPPVQTANPLRLSDVPTRILDMIRPQAEQFGRSANEPPRDKLPPDAQRMRTWSLSQVSHHIVNDNPVEADELAALRKWQAGTEFPFGDLPLVVMTASLTDDGLDRLKGPGAEEHRAAHAAMARLSRNGQLIVAERSGHHVQLDEPELVVRTISEVVERAKK